MKPRFRRHSRNEDDVAEAHMDVAGIPLRRLGFRADPGLQKAQELGPWHSDCKRLVEGNYRWGGLGGLGVWGFRGLGFRG